MVFNYNSNIIIITSLNKLKKLGISIYVTWLVLDIDLLLIFMGPGQENNRGCHPFGYVTMVSIRHEGQSKMQIFQATCRSFVRILPLYKFFSLIYSPGLKAHRPAKLPPPPRDKPEENIPAAPTNVSGKFQQCLLPRYMIWKGECAFHMGRSFHLCGLLASGKRYNQAEQRHSLLKHRTKCRNLYCLCLRAELDFCPRADWIRVWLHPMETESFINPPQL